MKLVENYTKVTYFSQIQIWEREVYYALYLYLEMFWVFFKFQHFYVFLN